MKFKTQSLTLASLKLLQLLPAIVSAQSMDGDIVYAYNSSGCNTDSYYTTFQLQTGYPSCVTASWEDPNFNTTAGGAYEVYWDFPQPPEGCKVFLRSPAAVDNPLCGNVVGSFSNAICTLLDVTNTFDLSWCCGTTNCTNALNPGQNSRRTLALDQTHPPLQLSTTLDDAVEVRGPIEIREAGKPRESAEALVPDLANLKSRNPLESKHKRVNYGNCAYAGNEPFTTEGDAQQITSSATCSTSSGCMIASTYLIMTGSTNTIGVSESLEIGLFELVQSTTTFMYMYSWMKSMSVSTAITYTVPAGATGYLTFTPTMQCTTGSFSGSDCANINATGMGIPTGMEGSACIPLHLSDGMTPQGTVNFVESN